MQKDNKTGISLNPFFPKLELVLEPVCLQYLEMVLEPFNQLGPF